MNTCSSEPVNTSTTTNKNDPILISLNQISGIWDSQFNLIEERSEKIVSQMTEGPRNRNSKDNDKNDGGKKQLYSPEKSVLIPFSRLQIQRKPNENFFESI